MDYLRLQFVFRINEVPMTKKTKSTQLGTESKAVEKLARKATKKRKQIGKRLKKLRRDHDLLQPELAEKLGWSQSKVSKIEWGKLKLDVVEFLQILASMKCSKEDARYVLYGKRRPKDRGGDSSEEVQDDGTSKSAT